MTERGSTAPARPAGWRPAPAIFPKVKAEGSRHCKGCREDVWVHVTAERDRDGAPAFVAWCDQCGGRLGAITPRKVPDEGRAALTKVLDEVCPPPTGLFVEAASHASDGT